MRQLGFYWLELTILTFVMSLTSLNVSSVTFLTFVALAGNPA